VKNTSLISWLVLLTLAGCSGEATPPPQESTPQESATLPSAPQGEVVIDRYKGEGLLLVATPSTFDPSYTQFVADSADINKLARDIELTIVEVFGGASGGVRGGPPLDAQSITKLTSQYAPDSKTMTVVVIGGDGKEIVKQSGQVNVKTMLEGL
jgi:hypothetical protein